MSIFFVFCFYNNTLFEVCWSIYISQGISAISSPAIMKTLANFMVSSPISTVNQKQKLKRVCMCLTQVKARSVGQVGRGCVDNTHGSSKDSSILVKSPFGDNSFSVVFYHSLISTSNDEERDTTHGVESNEHHSFILALDSSGFFKRRESPWCFNDPPFTRHMVSPPN